MANLLQFNFTNENGELVDYKKLDPFSLLSLAQTFPLENTELEQAFRNALSKTHPDKFINATDTQKLIATQYSVDINNAYKDLQNPVFRAITLAKIFHIIDDENLNTVTVSPDILMQVMEYQEQLQSADATSKRKLKKIIIGEIAEIKSTINTKLLTKDPTIKSDIVQLNYWYKLTN